MPFCQQHTTFDPDFEMSFATSFLLIRYLREFYFSSIASSFTCQAGASSAENCLAGSGSKKSTF